MKNNPWSWLGRLGVMKNVSKSMEAGHSVPERGSPTMSKPDPNDRKPGVTTVTIKGTTAGITPLSPMTKPLEHARRNPPNMERGTPDPSNAPRPKSAKPPVTTDVQKVSRDPEFKQPDPAMTATRKSAKTANIEGNESAKYEKLEKKTLKGLKGGGTEKELREGHNTKGAVSKKISHLVKSEGKPQKQAVAMALNMEREGRLTKEGGYKRVGKKGKK